MWGGLPSLELDSDIYEPRRNVLISNQKVTIPHCVKVILQRKNILVKMSQYLTNRLTLEDVRFIGQRLINNKL